MIVVTHEPDIAATPTASFTSKTVACNATWPSAHPRDAASELESLPEEEHEEVPV